VINENGSQEYYEYGKCHRPWQEGPAILLSDGYLGYYEHGRKHRPVSDGPAVTLSTGSTQYWEHGVLLWKVGS
jgi:hypothetical protein